MMFVVYNDADEPIAYFEDEVAAWQFARQYTVSNYVEDGCAYVEEKK